VAGEPSRARCGRCSAPSTGATSKPSSARSPARTALRSWPASRSWTSAHPTTTRPSASSRRPSSAWRLLQALPDLRGEDEEQDVLLAGLAGQFTPEDLQLLYRSPSCATRSGLRARRRARFEMAPLGGCSLSAPKRPAASGAPSRRQERALGSAAAARVRRSVALVRRQCDCGDARRAPPVIDGGAEAAMAGHRRDARPARARRAAGRTLRAGRSHGWSRQTAARRAGEDFRRPQLEAATRAGARAALRQPVRVTSRSATRWIYPLASSRGGDERQKSAEQAIEADTTVRACARSSARPWRRGR